MERTFFIATFTTFLVIILCHARHNDDMSLVLGLTHSRASSLAIPSASTAATLKPFDMKDVIEPLREVRDGYLISLNLGTPPQVVQVYMDTGSDLTWVPCGSLTFDCIECDEYRIMPTFSPLQSTSAQRDLCNSSFCIDLHSSDNSYDPCTVAGCGLRTLFNGSCLRPCPSFSYTYAGGVVTGYLTSDNLIVHGSSPNVTMDFPSFVFGCAGVAYQEPIGIAGFGRGALSLPSQLGLLQKAFSHCFLTFKYVNNPNISSPLVIGDLAISTKNDSQFTLMLRSPMYPNFYYIGLESITVGDETAVLEAPSSLSSFDSEGNGGFLIDSGTTYTHLPEPIYSQLITKLQSLINLTRATEVETNSGFDLCYNVPYSVSNRTASDDLLPSMSFHFLNNVTLVLPKENYFYAMRAPSNSIQPKCLLLQSMDDRDNSGPAGVFGNFQQHNVEVVYDLMNKRIGFHPMDCALAAASQGLHSK